MKLLQYVDRLVDPVDPPTLTLILTDMILTQLPQSIRLGDGLTRFDGFVHIVAGSTPKIAGLIRVRVRVRVRVRSQHVTLRLQVSKLTMILIPT